MPKPDRLHEYAQLGAAIRLKQLQDEVREIYKAFPALRFLKRSAAQASAASTMAESEPPSARKRRRKRRTLTAAEKKAIGARMKQYWAKRKQSEQSGKTNRSK